MCVCVRARAHTHTHTHIHNTYKYIHPYIQDVERWIVCTPLSVNVFQTLATQQHLEYRCKDLFETPCITSESHIEP
jgi:hypothetical protein